MSVKVEVLWGLAVVALVSAVSSDIWYLRGAACGMAIGFIRWAVAAEQREPRA